MKTMLPWDFWEDIIWIMKLLLSTSRTSLIIIAIVFQSLTTLPPHSNVVALGRDSFGKLITTCGVLNFEAGGGLPEHMLSTCKISKEYEGWPLFDFHGTFLGINLSSCTEGTSFLTERTVVEQLIECICLEEKFPAHLNSFKISNLDFLSKHGDGLNEEDLESLGYPVRPKTMLTDGILANNFEEPFGETDTNGEGVWGELEKIVASNIHENIVALASFNGEKRFFACTGCFIEWNGCATILTTASLIRDSFDENEILKNLRIEVLLPSKKQAAGILQHYNLHYNIALVRVNDYCPGHTVKIQHRWRENREVLAVGRIFKSGELMASRGRKVRRVGDLDCKYLEFSTCRIAKAGIGGPLLDFDGKFVGMNFYDKYAEGTWYLSWGEILKVLGYFEKKKDC